MNDQANPSEAKVWYALQAKPRQERVALENLQRQGYQAWLPLARTTRLRQRRHVECIEPLFPRYLFIQLDRTSDNWGPIRSTLGVSGMVRFGLYCPAVPQPLIDALRARSDENGVCDLLGKSRAGLQVGDAVVVADGIMAGYRGLIEAHSGKERVRILLDVLAGEPQRSVELPLADVVASS